MHKYNKNDCFNGSRVNNILTFTSVLFDFITMHTYDPLKKQLYALAVSHSLLLVGSSHLSCLIRAKKSRPFAWRLSREITSPGVASSHTYSYWLTRTTKCPMTHNPISLVRCPTWPSCHNSYKGKPTSFFPFCAWSLSKLMNIILLLKFPTVVALFPLFLWLCGLGIIIIAANICCV